MPYQEIGEATTHQFVECNNESCSLFEEEQEHKMLVSYSIVSAAGEWTCTSCLKQYEWIGDSPEFDEPEYRDED
jgi:hypothetical protein